MTQPEEPTATKAWQPGKNRALAALHSEWDRAYEEAANARASGTSQEVSLTVRFPAELHAALKKLAKKEDRSLNAQIVNLLRKAMGPT